MILIKSNAKIAKLADIGKFPKSTTYGSPIETTIIQLKGSLLQSPQLIFFC